MRLKLGWLVVVECSQIQLLCIGLALSKELTSPLSVQPEGGEVELTERTVHIVGGPAQHSFPGLSASVLSGPVLDQPGGKLGERGQAGQLLLAPFLRGK